MAERTIIWAESAVRQRRKVFQYWNIRNGSKEYSRKLLSEIQYRLSVLANYPEMGKKTTFQDTRALIIQYYTLFYTYNKDYLEVILFWDNRQNPSTLFKKMKQ